MELLALQKAELWLLPRGHRGTDFSAQRNAFCHPAWCQALATGCPLSHRELPEWLCWLTSFLGPGVPEPSAPGGGKRGKIKPEDP